MVNIAVVPIVGTGTFTVGSDNYSAQVNNIVLTPTYPTAVWKGMDGTSITTQGFPVWTLQIGYAIDTYTANSLALYLLNNQSTTKTASVVIGGKSYTVTVLIQSGALGGAADALITSSVTLPVQGQPTVAAAI